MLDKFNISVTHFAFISIVGVNSSLLVSSQALSIMMITLQSIKFMRITIKYSLVYEQISLIVFLLQLVVFSNNKIVITTIFNTLLSFEEDNNKNT